MAPIDSPAPIEPPPVVAPPTSRRSTGGSTQPKSLQGLSVALVVLFALGGLVSLVGALLTFSAVNDVVGIRDDDRGAFVELVAADDANVKFAGSVGLWGLVAIPILVLLVIWTHRAHRNLAAFGAEQPMLPSGMAIGSWFIPLFWYLGPYWCMADAHRGAAPESIGNSQWRQLPGSKALLAWWLSFSAATVLFIVGFGVASSGGSSDVSFDDTSIDTAIAITEEPDTYITGWSLVGAAHGLSLAAAMLAIAAVRTISDRHGERIRAAGGHA